MPETAAVAIGAASPRRPSRSSASARTRSSRRSRASSAWRFAAARAASDDAERRAQRLIGASFFAIALYVAVEAGRSLIGGHEPDASWVGVAARRPARQRGARLVLGRPRHRARHRRGGRAVGPRGLARRGVLHGPDRRRRRRRRGLLRRLPLNPPASGSVRRG
jgi:hypothetical protein